MCVCVCVCVCVAVHKSTYKLAQSDLHYGTYDPRFTLHLFRIIHTFYDVSQKRHFMRRVHIIPQLRRY